MKQTLPNILIISLSLFPFCFNAQSSVYTSPNYNDGIFIKENANNKKYIPYTHLREADVAWEKRVWRRIDLKEKTNQAFYYPIEMTSNRKSFLQVLLKSILSKEIIAFSDEEFQVPYELSEIRNKLVIRSDSQDVEFFTETGEPVLVKSPGPVDSTWMFENFASIDIKEDWFFDKQKSVMEVRIVGIGINATLKDKEDLGPVNQFWIYFPACRPYFSKHEMHTTNNDGERRTFDDIFWKRKFSSSVLKENNVYDRPIESYAKGLDAQLESDKIKMDIFKWEHDLWHF
ncbi:MAG: gliding motility protein GldN [Bacteroidota bacterium]|nr:gliding motility protein GldN [Bacteroidota bacterium]